MQKAPTIYHLSKLKIFILPHIYVITLSFILIALFFIRVYKLTDIPAGFSFDEASIGYNAYSILTNGHDEYGIFFPSYFKAFGEYKNPVQIYSTIPFVAILGLNEHSVRLVSVVYGIASVYAIYLLTKLFVNTKKSIAGIIAAIALGIVPWHFHLSRFSLEAMMPYLLFVILGTYFFLKKFSQRNILLSGIFFVLAVYSYFPSRIFVPLFVISLSIIYKSKLIRNWKPTLLALIFSLMLLSPFFIHSFSPEGMTRWNSVSIFVNGPDNKSKILPLIVNNYLSHFSYDFLFKKGDIDMPGQSFTMYSVRGFGELYKFQLPFALLGGLYLIYRRKYRLFAVISSWLLLYPLGSCFTTAISAQATRSIIGVVPFQILTALGIMWVAYSIRNIKARTIFIVVLACVALFSFFKFLNSFYTKYPLYSSGTWGWQYGAREILSYYKNHQNEYDLLLFPPEFNAADIFIKFYAPNCAKCKVGIPDSFSITANQRILYAMSPMNHMMYPNFNLKEVKTLYYPDGKVAFIIGEIQKDIKPSSVNAISRPF